MVRAVAEDEATAGEMVRALNKQDDQNNASVMRDELEELLKEMDVIKARIGAIMGIGQ